MEAVAVPLAKDNVGSAERTVEATVRGECDSNTPCTCLDHLPAAVVSGTHVREARSARDVDRTVSSVVAAVRHVVSPVCTWSRSDVDQITSEGSRLASERRRRTSPVGPAGWTERLSVFGRKWVVRVGAQTTGQFGWVYDTASLYEDIQTVLLTHGMCLMDLDGATSAIIHHNNYLVMIDCGTCDSSGRPSRSGRSVVVFNTNMDDLMLHINEVIQTLKPRCFALRSLTVEESRQASGSVKYRNVESQVHAVLEEGRSSVHVNPVTSVQGTFHQGDPRFTHAGSQCMAISLVAMAKHKLSSVFSWQSDTVDEVVVTGDQLYTTLRDQGAINSETGFLMVRELPKEFVTDGQIFKLDYEDTDDVLGDVDIVSGEFIDTGVYSTLESGLEKVFRNNTTCFLTLGSNTCAIIRQDERYAIFDSHARSADGMIDECGFSVVLYFSNIQDVCKHIREFAGRLSVLRKTFEVAGVKVIKTGPVGHGEESDSVCSDRSPTSAASCQGGLKRPSSPQAGPSKKVRAAEREADVLLVTDVTTKKHQFNPLRQDVAADLCFRLNVESEKVESLSKEVGQLGVPHLNDKIVSDGNCFFRAVCQAVCGTQKYHRKIRLEVVKLMATNAVEYRSLLRSQYSSMNEYLELSKMKFLGSWATELEIQATADYFGVNIFTYGESGWLEYRCRRKLFSNQAIYLENCDGNHYETVVCAKQPQSQGCYTYCKESSHSKVYNLREQRTLKSSPLMIGSSDENCVAEPVTGGCLNLYQKRKLALYQKNRYKQNVLFREKEKDRLKNRYLKNTLYQHIVKKRALLAYSENLNFRDKAKAKSIEKHRISHVSYREQVKKMKRRKYASDDVHRLKQKTRSKASSLLKYQLNDAHRLQKKIKSKVKYQLDDAHRLQKKARSRVSSLVKYQLDDSHRHCVRTKSIRKYHDNPEHKKRVVDGNRKKRELKKKAASHFENVMEQFLEKVKDGPDFVCCVCYRLLFRHQVVQCRRKLYKGKKEKTAVADRCISEEYLHKCSEGCVSPCLWLDSARGQLWICTTCHQKLSRGQMPAECAVNKLVPDPIPHELACLNSLEQHLIALHIPFMKMLALPKGGQNGVHGPVTCVPANIVQTNNLLPRSNMEGSLLPVKLKRKLTYKGHYRYQFVDTMRIRQALHYLKHHNSYYRDIEFNEEWLNAFCKEESSVDVVDGTGVEGELEDELLHDRQQHCMFQDTCLMPVDIGQETLDQYLDTILNVAPAEGNNPVSLLTDRANEAKCFPVLFPQGLNTYHESRVYQLSLSRYFNNRILNADGRFAQNVEYIFYAQYLSELEQVVSKVSIALRKGGSNSQTVPQDLLNNDEALKELFQRDDGYRFLTPIRGTPPFWQGVQRDLFACVRQLGIPTWFCSFSSADLRWKNLLTSILIQEGRTETAEQLEWADRCDLLRRNPVTAV